MNSLFTLISSSKLRKIILTLNLFFLLSFANIANATIMLESEGWDGAGQNAFDVKYFFGDLTLSNTPSITSPSVDSIKSAFLIAFNAWSDATNNNLTFTEIFTAGQNDSIDISFENISHGDGFPFGASTLAHAFYPDDVTSPIIAGDLHMNKESFSWEIGDTYGSSAFDITLVAVHEIGHSIGLGHTIDDLGNPVNSGNVMDPGISSRSVFSELSPDDVNAVCSLYLCTSAVVSEPSSIVLIMLGIFGTMVSARRKLLK